MQTNKQNKHARTQGDRARGRSNAENTRRREVCAGTRTALTDPTDEDIELLKECEREFSRAGSFRRVYPVEGCVDTARWSKYFETKRYYNALLLEWVMRAKEHAGLTVEEYVSLRNGNITESNGSGVIKGSRKSRQMGRGADRHAVSSSPVCLDSLFDNRIMWRGTNDNGLREAADVAAVYAAHTPSILSNVRSTSSMPGYPIQGSGFVSQMPGYATQDSVNTPASTTKCTSPPTFPKAGSMHGHSINLNNTPSTTSQLTVGKSSPKFLSLSTRQRPTSWSWGT